MYYYRSLEYALHYFQLSNQLFCFRSKNIGTTAKDTRQATVILDRNTAIDNSEVERLKADKLRYLLGALQNYSNALSLGTRHDLKTFRLISLW